PKPGCSAPTPRSRRPAPAPRVGPAPPAAPEHSGAASGDARRSVARHSVAFPVSDCASRRPHSTSRLPWGRRPPTERIPGGNLARRAAFVYSAALHGTPTGPRRTPPRAQEGFPMKRLRKLLGRLRFPLPLFASEDHAKARGVCRAALDFPQMRMRRLAHDGPTASVVGLCSTLLYISGRHSVGWV